MAATIDKIELFPFYNEFFNRDSTIYPELTEKAKCAHWFSLRRALAKRDSNFMEFFNKISEPTETIIDGLRNMYITPNGRQPKFMYTKQGKGSETANNWREKITKYSVDTLKLFKKEQNIYGADFEEFLKVFPTEAFERLDEIEKLYNQDGKKKRSTR